MNCSHEDHEGHEDQKSALIQKPSCASCSSWLDFLAKSIDKILLFECNRASLSNLVTPKLLTAAEVVMLVGRLTGQSISPRQVRYLLITGSLGTDVQPRRPGETRLYDVIDVALVRLAVRITMQGGSRAVARVVLTYLRDHLIRAWKAGAPLALAIRGVRGSIEPALRTAPSWATIWIPLREVWRGLDREIQQVSDTRSTVWAWRQVPVRAVRRA